MHDYIDPRSRVQARQAARAAWAGAEETKKLKYRARNYVPGYGNPSPMNRDTTQPIRPFGPAVPPLPRPAMPIPAPASTWPAEKARIEAQYGPHGTANNTPPTSIVPQGNPNALKPGQGWQSSQYDPRGTTALRAPDGIQEQVGYGGHIASMYRPPAYNTFPGESPTGVIHNNVPKPAPAQPTQAAQQPAAPAWHKQLIDQLPQLQVLDSAANKAFRDAYHSNGGDYNEAFVSAQMAQMDEDKARAKLTSQLAEQPISPISQSVSPYL